MSDRKEIRQRLRKAMEFYQELGFGYLPVKRSQTGGVIGTGQTRGAVTAAPHPAPQPGAKADTVSFAAEPAQQSPDKAVALEDLRKEIGDCRRCRLSDNRTNIVFGEGSLNAEIMFIGEGPGKDEDLQARPFVGDAGKLLNRLIERLGMKREEVFIANIVKCRPPGNREPQPDEIETCIPFLKRQIDIIGPGVIVSLGKISAQSLLKSKTPISRMRGTFTEYNAVPLMPTFHPAYLLRNPKDKILTWNDMLKVLNKLGKPLPERAS